MAHLVREGTIVTALDRQMWWKAMLRAEELLLDFTEPTPKGARQVTVKVVHGGGHNQCVSVSEALDLDSRSRFEVMSIECRAERGVNVTMTGVDRHATVSIRQINIDPIGLIKYEVWGLDELAINGFADILSAVLEKFAAPPPTPVVPTEVGLSRVRRRIGRAVHMLTNQPMAVQVIGGILATLLAAGATTWFVAK